MKWRTLPDSELLHRLFRYDPKTGALYRKIATTNSCRMGVPAGWKAKDGYIAIKVLGFDASFLVHRLIWKMFRGDPPPGLVIDHINRVKDDNRIENLRCVDHQENMRNSYRHAEFASRHVGVYRTRSGTWGVRFGDDYGTIYLGRYDTEAEAVAARNGGVLMYKRLKEKAASEKDAA